MQNLQNLSTESAYTHAVELVMIDEQKRQKRAVLLFNLSDEWRSYENMTDTDIQGMFAGAIMQVAKNDKSAIACKATSFAISDNTVQRLVCFTPLIRIMHVKKDGSFDYVMSDEY